MEKTLSKLQQFVWYLTFAAVIFAPSFRSVDYKSYAVSIGFLLLLLLEALRFFKKPELHFSPLEIYLALYVAWTCLSYFWSPVDLAASEYLGRFLPCVGIYWLIRQEGKDPFSGLAVWLIGAYAAMGYGLLQGLHLDFIPDYSQSFNGRIFSTFGNPNVFAAFLVLTFPVVTLGLAPLKSKKMEFIRLGSFIILFLMSLVLTQSRAGFLALSLQMVALVGLAWRQFSKIKYGKLTLVFLAALVLGFLAYKVAPFAGRPTERLEVWKGTVQMWVAKPFVGLGVGQFSFNFSSYVTPEIAEQMRKDNTFTEHAHNEVLELAVELGLVGVLVAALFWLRLIGRALRQAFFSPSQEGYPRLVTAGLVIGLLGVGVTNLVDYNCRLSGVAFFIWLTAGLLANRVFPTDKIKLPSPAGILLGVLLLGGAAFGLVQEVRLMGAVLAENPQRDFLKDLPADAGGELNKILADIKAQPNNDANYLALGNIYAKLGKMDEAQKAFEKVLELNPKSNKAYLNLGNIYLLTADTDLGRMELARECYEKSIELDPKSVDGHFNLAYVYFLHKDLKEALNQLDEVLKMDPQNAKALSLKRQILP